MTDLGILAGDTCATAYAINSSEQIVGDSGNCHGINRGFLVENGGPIVDLQTLVLPGSDVTISETNYINDAGEITGFGTNSNDPGQPAAPALRVGSVLILPGRNW